MNGLLIWIPVTLIALAIGVAVGYFPKEFIFAECKGGSHVPDNESFNQDNVFEPHVHHGSVYVC